MFPHPPFFRGTKIEKVLSPFPLPSESFLSVLQQQLSIFRPSSLLSEMHTQKREGERKGREKSLSPVPREEDRHEPCLELPANGVELALLFFLSFFSLFFLSPAAGKHLTVLEGPAQKVREHVAEGAIAGLCAREGGRRKGESVRGGDTRKGAKKTRDKKTKKQKTYGR